MGEWAWEILRRSLSEQTALSYSAIGLNIVKKRAVLKLFMTFWESVFYYLFSKFVVGLGCECWLAVLASEMKIKRSPTAEPQLSETFCLELGSNCKIK